METLKPDNEDRKIGVSEPKKVYILTEEREGKILNKFNTSISELKSNISVPINCQSLLNRSCIVLAVSAMDFYIHEIVKYMILVIFDGRAAKTPKYNDFILSLQCVERAIKNPESLDWLEEEIFYRNSYKSFQRSEKIADAIKIIYGGKIWDEIAKKLQKEKKTIKAELDSIIELRDDIAHQDSSMIEEDNESADTIRRIEFIEELINTVHSIIFAT